MREQEQKQEPEPERVEEDEQEHVRKHEQDQDQDQEQEQEQDANPRPALKSVVARQPKEKAGAGAATDPYKMGAGRMVLLACKEAKHSIQEVKRSLIL